MLGFKKIRNPKGGKVHLQKVGAGRLCSHTTIDAEEVPMNGPKCNCKDCLSELGFLMRQELRDQEEIVVYSVSFDEQRHSFNPNIPRF